MLAKERKPKFDPFGVERGVALNDPRYWKRSAEERVSLLEELGLRTGQPSLSAEESSKLRVQMEDEDREIAENLAALKAANRLFVPYRRGVYPYWNTILTPGPKYRGMSAEKLFHFMGILEERLTEVYEYGDVRVHTSTSVEIQEGFTGSFTPNGKQRLANILGKPIDFYFQPHSEPVVLTDTKESFEPQTG